MSEHFEEHDLDEEPDVRDKLTALWRELGSPESSELPADLLEEHGISQEEYHDWRMDIAGLEREKRDVLADAATAEGRAAARAEQGKGPLTPDFTPEERDTIERRKLEAELRNKRLSEIEAEGESGWGQEFDDERR